MDFEILVNSIEQTHKYFQHQANKAVNVALTLRNWLIGYYIVEFEQKGEQRAQYGEKLLYRLAERCSSVKGLDERSLRNFRLFYQYYPQIQKAIIKEIGEFAIWGSLPPELQTDIDVPSLHGNLIVSKLSYTHLEFLIKIPNPLKRVFYELECIKGNWSVREK